MKNQIPVPLDDKNKVGMLLALFNHGSMKKTDLYLQIPRSNLNAQKLDDLAKVGLVVLVKDRFDNNKTSVELTDLGRSIAKKLQDIEDLMEGKDSQEPEPEMNCRTPEKGGDQARS